MLHPRFRNNSLEPTAVVESGHMCRTAIPTVIVDLAFDSAREAAVHYRFCRLWSWWWYGGEFVLAVVLAVLLLPLP